MFEGCNSLDADTSFAINQSGEVGKFCIVHD